MTTDLGRRTRRGRGSVSRNRDVVRQIRTACVRGPQVKAGMVVVGRREVGAALVCLLGVPPLSLQVGGSTGVEGVPHLVHAPQPGQELEPVLRGEGLPVEAATLYQAVEVEDDTILVVVLLSADDQAKGLLQQSDDLNSEAKVG